MSYSGQSARLCLVRLCITQSLFKGSLTVVCLLMLCNTVNAHRDAMLHQCSGHAWGAWLCPVKCVCQVALVSEDRCAPPRLNVCSFSVVLRTWGTLASKIEFVLSLSPGPTFIQGLRTWTVTEMFCPQGGDGQPEDEKAATQGRGSGVRGDSWIVKAVTCCIANRKFRSKSMWRCIT